MYEVIVDRMKQRIIGHIWRTYINLIDRLLPTKFDSLRILQLEGPPQYTSRIFPSTLSDFHDDWVLLTI